MQAKRHNSVVKPTTPIGRVAVCLCCALGFAGPLLAQTLPQQNQSDSYPQQGPARSPAPPPPMPIRASAGTDQYSNPTTPPSGSYPDWYPQDFPYYPVPNQNQGSPYPTTGNQYSPGISPQGGYPNSQGGYNPQGSMPQQNTNPNGVLPGPYQNGPYYPNSPYYPTGSYSPNGDYYPNNSAYPNVPPQHGPSNDGYDRSSSRSSDPYDRNNYPDNNSSDPNYQNGQNNYPQREHSDRLIYPWQSRDPREIYYDRYPQYDQDRGNRLLPGVPVAVPPDDNPRGPFYDIRRQEDLEKAKAVRETRRVERLLRFGEGYFTQARAQLVDTNEASVPSNYMLGPGDEISLIVYNVHGGERSETLTVDQKGDILVPGAGPVDVAGMTLANAQTKVNQLVQGLISGMRARLTMDRVRKVRVFLLGEVRRPGGILINPTANIVDALLAGGGPTPTGSFRKIELRRNDAVVAKVDLYDLLIHGRTNFPHLQNGDKIFIPVTGPQVAVEGEVYRPAYYELYHEQTLQQVLHLAGGIKPEAYGGAIQLEHVRGNAERTMRDVRLQEVAHTLVTGGDSVVVGEVLEELANAAYVGGAVKRPGWYALHPGMTITSIVRAAQGLRDGAYPEHLEVFRRETPGEPLKLLGVDYQKAWAGDHNEDIALKPRDQVIVFDRKSATFNQERVRVQGEVTRPGEYPRYGQMTVRDLIFQAGGVTALANTTAEIARRSPDGHVDTIPLNLPGLMAAAPDAPNPTLENGDLLVVRPDLRGRQFPATVVLGGEVAHPGIYAIDPTHESLVELIERAGGLTDQAYAKGTIFLRKENEIARRETLALAKDTFDTIQSIARQYAAADAARRAASSAAGAIGGGVNLSTLTNGQAILSPRQIDRILTSNRVPVDMRAVLNHHGGDPGLRDGDSIYVPAEPTTVLVAGAVFVPSPMVFDRRRSVEDYINRAGGFTRDADRESVVVLRVSGETFRAKMLKHLEPGDLILVPPKAIVSNPDAWDRLVNLAQIATGAYFLSRL